MLPKRIFTITDDTPDWRIWEIATEIIHLAHTIQAMRERIEKLEGTLRKALDKSFGKVCFITSDDSEVLMLQLRLLAYINTLSLVPQFDMKEDAGAISNQFIEHQGRIARNFTLQFMTS